MTANTTLQIRIVSSESSGESFLGRAEQTDRGMEDTVLALSEEEALGRVLSPRTVGLLRVIASENPESIRETAQIVNRDMKEVSWSLRELNELGVVEFERTGSMRRPVVPFDQLDISVPIIDAPETDDGTETTMI